MTLFDIKYDDFKREDTTNVITITLYTDDKQPITPNASHTWKAKVSKEDKYVGEYPVIISGNTIKLSSSNLTRLPNGDYGLELWETYNGSTTIYPSAGVMEFRVHRNANDTLGTIDPTTDINGIIDDLHKAGQNIKVVATNTLSPGSKASVTQSITNGENQLTFNIPQGDKGDKGDVGPAPTLKIGTVTKLNPDQAPTADLNGDNGSYTLNMGIPQGVQGETNETATNALNLAKSVGSEVTNILSNGGGRNLARGTSSDWRDLKDFDNKTNYSVYPANIYLDTLQSGDTMIWGITLKNTGIVSGSFVIQGSGNVTGWNDGALNGKSYDISKDLPAGTTKTFILTTVINKTQKQNDYFSLQLRTDNIPKGGTLSYRCIFAEKGPVIHDWSPAPEDIQSEIDALKEAVKKLGGGDNLAPLVAPVMRNGGTDAESVTHGHAQRFALPIGEVELLPKTNILVDVLSGDTLSQSFVIETDATSINGSFTFFMLKSGNHHIAPFNVQQLTATKYLVSASYTTGTNDEWRILDIMRLNLTGGTYVELSNPYAAIDLSGGVAQTNLLADWATNNALNNQTTTDTTVQSKITNAVLSFDVKSSSIEYIDFYKKDVSLTPGHTYKLSYMARGTGIMRNHLYAWTNKGSKDATDSLCLAALTDG